MMQRAIGIIGVGIGLMLLLSAAVPAQQAVVPGLSIGTITLGMPRAEVWKHLGKPTEIHFLHFAGRSYTWDDWDSDRQREVVTSFHGYVVQIERNVAYTEAQINQGEWRKDTFSVIRRHHSYLKATLYNFQEEVGAVVLIDDRQQGVAWSKSLLHFEGDHKMDVFSEICPEKVIVHRRRSAVLPDAGEVLSRHDPLMNDFHAWCSAKP